MITAQEIKDLYDSSQAYAKGFADGAASILQTIVKKLEEQKNVSEKQTKVEDSKTFAQASK